MSYESFLVPLFVDVFHVLQLIKSGERFQETPGVSVLLQCPFQKKSNGFLGLEQFLELTGKLQLQSRTE